MVGFQASETLLRRALTRIPTGSQTFSKSRVQFPEGHSPLFLERGKGGRAWDVDGNEYVDLVCGLLPVLLGYCDPDVDRAISDQLQNGITLSLATSLEIEVAEALSEIVPCAEMTRFGKNGSDATSACVRIARAVTGRDHIVVCGYHGWQDWYIGSTSRHKGVPKCVRDLTHAIDYGDSGAFHDILTKHSGDVAGIIMEPSNVSEPPDGYLAEMRELAHRHGCLFMFDEVITGFRFANGGAQELFGVVPDLAAFGKGLGNGMPISAVVGKAQYMRYFEEVFFSGTFGGETLSLAAAMAVLDKIRRKPVVDHLYTFGGKLKQTVEALIDKYGLGQVLTLRGRPCWVIVGAQDHASADRHQIATFLMTRGFQQGILANGSHNVCYAHDDRDLAQCQHAYTEILSELAAHLADGDLGRALGCEPAYPIFSVRSKE